VFSRSLPMQRLRDFVPCCRHRARPRHSRNAFVANARVAASRGESRGRHERDPCVCDGRADAIVAFVNAAPARWRASVASARVAFGQTGRTGATFANDGNAKLAIARVSMRGGDPATRQRRAQTHAATTVSRLESRFEDGFIERVDHPRHEVEVHAAHQVGVLPRERVERAVDERDAVVGLEAVRRRTRRVHRRRPLAACVANSTGRPRSRKPSIRARGEREVTSTVLGVLRDDPRAR
jgi:hypothetical protein